MTDIRVFDRFTLKKQVGSGAFGLIFGGKDLETGKNVAVKMESLSAKHPLLKYESKIYRKLQNSFGIPAMIQCGVDGDFYCLVMELMGPSLQDVFEDCNCKFSLKTVMMLADQMISRLEYLHAHKLLHRDVKPENFVLGAGKQRGIVHIIDFGLSKKFVDHNMEHIPYREGKPVVGTARYASVNACLGFEQGRRDELEALGFNLVYFLLGRLPWQGMRKKKKDSASFFNRAVANKKVGTPVSQLCKDLPIEFCKYFDYCRELSFREKPDYDLLRRLFQDLAAREGIVYDGHFDWVNAAKWKVSQSKRSTTASPQTPVASPNLSSRNLSDISQAQSNKENDGTKHTDVSAKSHEEEDSALASTVVPSTLLYKPSPHGY